MLVVPCTTKEIEEKISSFSQEEKNSFIREGYRIITEDNNQDLVADDTQSRTRLILMMEKILGTQLLGGKDFHYKVENYFQSQRITAKGRETKRHSKGEEFARLRRKLHLTQLGLAMKLEMQRLTVHRWEKNKIRIPKKAWMWINSAIEKKNAE